MGFLTRLPWWTGYPLSVGLGGMTTFAGSVLTDAQQALGFAFSAMLFAAGIVATIWHFGLSGWFRRHVWWRFGRYAPQEAVKTELAVAGNQPTRSEATCNIIQAKLRDDGQMSAEKIDWIVPSLANASREEIDASLVAASKLIAAELDSVLSVGRQIYNHQKIIPTEGPIPLIGFASEYRAAAVEYLEKLEAFQKANALQLKMVDVEMAPLEMLGRKSVGGVHEFEKFLQRMPENLRDPEITKMQALEAVKGMGIWENARNVEKREIDEKRLALARGSQWTHMPRNDLRNF